MNDQPGSSWSNPIWYGKWRIYLGDGPYPFCYNYVHDDYDGAEDAGDSRCGIAHSVEDAKRQIDEDH